MKKTLMTMIVTAIISLSLYAANMASQPWVNMRIAQQETNTQAVVDYKLSTATGVVTEVWVDARLAELEEQMRREMQSAIEILGNTNDEHSVEKSMTMQSAASLPLADYIMSRCGSF